MLAPLVALVFEIMCESFWFFPRGKGFGLSLLENFSSRSEAGSQGCAACRAPRSGLALTGRFGSATPGAGSLPRAGRFSCFDRDAINHLCEYRSPGLIRTLYDLKSSVRTGAGLPIRRQALKGPWATREDRASTPRRRNSSASIRSRSIMKLRTSSFRETATMAFGVLRRLATR